jgi:hypothetical protein
VNLDSEFLASKALGQGIPGCLTDEILIIVGEDVHLADTGRGDKPLDPARRNAGPDGNSEHLVSRQGGLDAFRNPELFRCVMESDGAADDRIDRWHDLLSRLDIGVVDPLHAEQVAVRADDRSDDGGKAPDELMVIVVIGAPDRAAQRR